jgi:hypothetical protein
VYDVIYIKQHQSELYELFKTEKQSDAIRFTMANNGVPFEFFFYYFAILLIQYLAVVLLKKIVYYSTSEKVGHFHENEICDHEP